MSREYEGRHRVPVTVAPKPYVVTRALARHHA